MPEASQPAAASATAIESRHGGSAGIASVAAAVPALTVPNEPIAGPLGVDSDWIASRTGVRERRMASEESLVDLAAEAGARALQLAGAEASEVELILVGTLTADDLLPNAAPLVAERLGARGSGAADLGAACTGFVTALSLAAGLIESGRVGSALVIGAEVLSRVTDYTDRRTAGLFGDGAGAALLTAGGPGRIGPIALRSDGSEAGLITAATDERLVRMDGRATFRAAVATLSGITREVASDAGLALDEIDLFVYHQANSRILTAVGERLGLSAERVMDCVERYGNTSAASVPIALAEAGRQGMLEPGSRVLLAAFGSGLTWGAGVIEWDGVS